MGISVRAAQHGDRRSVERLLTSVNLTAAGVGRQLHRFLVVEDAVEIVACAGLETYGHCALLRSVAVHANYRHRGLATSLVTQLFDQARLEGVQRIYLLTTTAEAYFRRLGFAVMARERVDPAVQQSAEFGDATCATARAMQLSLPGSAKRSVGSPRPAGRAEVRSRITTPRSRPSEKRPRGPATDNRSGGDSDGSRG